ncbi:GntR family transcriptional regulator [Bordetella genomosp. 9]|uniref:GntR family transcriptional regulator n=1 Tax=Bordetella genomosp. 9 TaxID=1416803 RepID=UPI0012FB8675|nr:GntR family transcriptional regulator [Bordetella genomosp. 9]
MTASIAVRLPGRINGPTSITGTPQKSEKAAAFCPVLSNAGARSEPLVEFFCGMVCRLNLIMSTHSLSAGVPIYHQIAQVLRRRIEAGEWGHGNHLATEQALCQEFGVSRTTVRHALSQLKREGLLSSRRGVGTRRVGEPARTKYVSSLSDPLHATLDSQPRVESVQLVSVRGQIADFLKLKEGDELLKLVRVHFLEGEPLSVVESYLPPIMQTAIDQFPHRSLHDIMWNDFGLKVAKSEHAVSIARADKHVADLLKIGLGDPVMHVRARTYLQDGRPVRWTDNFFREDRYQYTADFFWEPPPPRQQPERKEAGE